MPRALRIALIIIVLLTLLSISTGSIMDWLWMDQLGYAAVFWKIKLARISMLVVPFAVAAAYLLVNVRILADELRWAHFGGTPLEQVQINLGLPEQHRRARRILSTVAVVIAFFFALNFFSRWDAPLRLLGSNEFGIADPILGRDVGFYMFRLPFWELIQTAFTVLVFFATAVLILIYASTRLLRFELREGLMARPAVRRQVTLNAAAWLLLLAWGLYLERYQLLFSSDGLVFGAGYTDVHVELPAIWITMIVTILLAVIVAAGRRIRSVRLLPAAALLLVVVWVIGRAMLPALVQRIRVAPNELELEMPYLENEIAMTRLAYGLHDVEEVDYQADDTLTIADIGPNQDAVDNIRLWDPRLLIQTYSQLQEIRSYYEFFSVDNDRYFYDGELRQVMLSAREISTDLPGESVTWVNRHLQFTHGYGITMSPVARIDRQGEPILVIRDLPPQTTSDDLSIENPAIYYGEAGEGYYIVNSGAAELDYPAGDQNVYTHYEGEGGIPFSTWFHRLLFAWELGDPNILLSEYIHSESRLQIWRGVQERIRRISPFLELDSDPYLVLSEGRLFWIQDAYTTSRYFPYSRPFRELNYIRNSVKIVVDAYHGSVKYYVMDEEDPVLNVYRSIFPNLFLPIEELSDDLARHFRYPQDLFEMQIERFNRYHMTDPHVFYNNEDLWTRPIEKYAGEQIRMEPYYVLARLPAEVERGGEARLKYMQIMPVTPVNRDNMIAWLAAQSDPEDYGDLVVYKLPKERVIYGPAQIDARIDQDPEISEQLALWDQRGSRVIRGNLIVVPIENSFLYVEPVFLIAEGVDIPQLQRVIVAIGDNVAMEPTLDEAIYALFGEQAMPLLAERSEIVPAPADTLIQRIGNEELEEARRLWGELREAFEAGEWTRYGELMGELDEVIGAE